MRLNNTGRHHGRSMNILLFTRYYIIVYTYHRLLTKYNLLHFICARKRLTAGNRFSDGQRSALTVFFFVQRVQQVSVPDTVLYELSPSRTNTFGRTSGRRLVCYADTRPPSATTDGPVAYYASEHRRYIL